MSYWDEWFDSKDVFVYGGETLVDLETAYMFENGMTLTAGGQNVFDTVPEENQGARSGVGNLYSQFTPFGFNGTFWYARAKFEFDF